MARKRGGLAGFYDRNKGVLQAAAPFIAGTFGGPLAGAAIGAAMKGLDREGKSGIGFDLGQGLQGGISGYGAGSLGASAKKMFTGALAKRAAASGLESLPSADMASKIGMTGPARTASASIAPPVAPPPVTPPPAAPNVPFYKSKEGLEFIGKGMTAGASIMGQQSATAQAEREYEDQQRQLQARAELMAMFAPQMAGNLGMQLGGGIRPANVAPAASFDQYANDAASLAIEDPRVQREMETRGMLNLYGRPNIYGNPRTNFTTGPNRRTFMNNPERY